jgi:hypothetical protein
VPDMKYDAYLGLEIVPVVNGVRGVPFNIGLPADRLLGHYLNTQAVDFAGKTDELESRLRVQQRSIEALVVERDRLAGELAKRRRRWWW